MERSNGAELRLTPDQLQHLKRFIARRGFGEPATLLEILDHFACKVEELWPEHPQWTLDEAMEAAHNSFGAAGFYRIVKAFQAATHRRFRGLVIRAFWRVPVTLTGALTLLCTGWGYYTLHRICAAHQWFVFKDWNAANLVGYVVLILVQAILFWERRPNPFLRSVDEAVPQAVQAVVFVLAVAAFYEVSLVKGLLFFILAAWFVQAKATTRRIAVREQDVLLRKVYGS